MDSIYPRFRVACPLIRSFARSFVSFIDLARLTKLIEANLIQLISIDLYTHPIRVQWHWVACTLWMSMLTSVVWTKRNEGEIKS